MINPSEYEKRYFTNNQHKNIIEELILINLYRKQYKMLTGFDVFNIPQSCPFKASILELLRTNNKATAISVYNSEIKEECAILVYTYDNGVGIHIEFLCGNTKCPSVAKMLLDEFLAVVDEITPDGSAIKIWLVDAAHNSVSGISYSNYYDTHFTHVSGNTRYRLSKNTNEIAGFPIVRTPSNEHSATPSVVRSPNSRGSRAYPGKNPTYSLIGNTPHYGPAMAPMAPMAHVTPAMAPMAHVTPAMAPMAPVTPVTPMAPVTHVPLVRSVSAINLMNKNKMKTFDNWKGKQNARIAERLEQRPRTHRDYIRTRKNRKIGGSKRKNKIYHKNNKQRHCAFRTKKTQRKNKPQ